MSEQSSSRGSPSQGAETGQGSPGGWQDLPQRAGESPTGVPGHGPTSRTTESHRGGVPSHVRYRCAACGNLTRFDVVTNRQTKAFHHYSLGGELTIEEVDVLRESVEEVSCRWCGHGNAVEILGD